MINLHNMDCMVAMAEMKDNAFDLAIVDPPYGIGMAKGVEVGKWKRQIHKTKKWDDAIPTREYFDELKRVSKNQIVWGGNYFVESLANSRCWIFWDKKNGENFMSDGELAYTSFKSSVKRFVYNHIQDYNAGIERIHPTQKPVALYQWLLKNYAKQGDKILDTHLGSGSIALACHDMDYDLEGYETDEEYYNGAVKRLKKHQQQIRMFKTRHY